VILVGFICLGPDLVSLGEQTLEAWMVGERSILDGFLAKNDLVQWLGCWSQLQPLAIIMFLDASLGAQPWLWHHCS